MQFLNQYFVRASVAPERMDELWARGWRHFGAYFFRYSATTHWGSVRMVIPLRIDLARFTPSRSQKRVMAKNRDAKVVFRDAFIDKTKEDLFDRHRHRFKENVPDSIYDFLSDDPATTPCRTREICVYDGDCLVASSFLDIGTAATSAVYAMFDPDESRRSLGIFTMLEAIRYSRDMNCRYYYSGYAYREASVYDYKKNFHGLEYFDWKEKWHPFPRGGE